MAGMTRHINLDLGEKLFQKLTKEAKERDISRNKLIRTMLGGDNFFTVIKNDQKRIELKINQILKKLSKK